MKISLEQYKSSIGVVKIMKFDQKFERKSVMNVKMSWKNTNCVIEVQKIYENNKQLRRNSIKMVKMIREYVFGTNENKFKKMEIVSSRCENFIGIVLKYWRILFDEFEARNSFYSLKEINSFPSSSQIFDIES